MPKNWVKISIFAQIFFSSKEILGVPLFMKIPDFESSKGEVLYGDWLDF